MQPVGEYGIIVALEVIYLEAKLAKDMTKRTKLLIIKKEEPVILVD